MPPVGASSKRQLPSKEVSLFKELLNFYETRQLKKGQKVADQILKKFPDHGGMALLRDRRVICIHSFCRDSLYERARPHTHGSERRRP